jgi:hypothetical protein
MPLFSAPVDLGRNELRNAVTQNLGTAPASPVPGLRYYDTVLSAEQYWNGTKWVSLGTIDIADITGLGDLAYLDQVDADTITPGSISDIHISGTAAIALSKLAVDPLDRANHTNTQLAATISDFDLQVRTSRLDQMAMPTATVDFGGQVLTNLADPILPSDAANKAYADSVAAGLDVKDSVRAASTADVDITAPGTTLDDVALAAGDRVLLKNQTDATQNGIYVYNGDAVLLTRAPDADSDEEVTAGMFCFVVEGTEHSNSGWIMNTADPVVLDTSDLNWTQFSGAGTYVGTPDRIAITGNQIDIDPNYAGQASITTVGNISSGVWEGTSVDLAHGGTGATNAVDARAALQVAGKYTASIGDGTAKTFTINHGLNTKFVGVEISDQATGQTVFVDVRRVDNNNVAIEGFYNPPGVSPGAGLDVTIWG